jgi:hypothetical protein
MSAHPAFNIFGKKHKGGSKPDRHHGHGRNHREDPCKRQTKNKRHECHPKPKCHR